MAEEGLPEFTPEQPVEQYVVPTIDHLYVVDPLNLTADDCLLIVQHHRVARVNFMKLAEKPKTVQKSRGPKLDEEATRKAADEILNSMFGGD